MKKIISLVLCFTIILSMAVSAFAATDNSNGTFIPTPTVPGNNWVGPNNPSNKHDFNAPMNRAPKDNPGVRDIVPEEDEEEENPTTGAPVVFAIPAIIAAAGVSAFINKRK